MSRCPPVQPCSERRRNIEKISASEKRKGPQEEERQSIKPETEREDSLRRIIEDLERIREKVDTETGIVWNACGLLGGINVSELEEKIEGLLQAKES